MVTSYVKIVVVFATNTYIHVTDTMQQTVTDILENLLLKSVLK